jgi:hypothetical protein
MEDQNQDVTNHSDEEQLDANHSEQEQSVRDYYSAFGIDFPEEGEEDEQDDTEDEDEAEEQPTIVDEPAHHSQGVTVKYNGQEMVISDDEEIKTNVQKGLNYDKLKGESERYTTALDRLAKQHGFKNHAELMDNLDLIEQRQAQHEQNQFDQLKQHLRNEAENAGIDPEVLDNYIDNHPLLQQAKEVLEQNQKAQEARKQQETEQRQIQGWENLFNKYPQLSEQIDQSSGSAPWLTQDMLSRIERGYDPIDAYELSNKDAIMVDQRKKAEQAAIKNQRLNKRAAVVKDGQSSDLEEEIPNDVSEAFRLFGLDPSKAKKHIKRK